MTMDVGMYGEQNYGGEYYQQAGHQAYGYHDPYYDPAQYYDPSLHGQGQHDTAPVISTDTGLCYTNLDYGDLGQAYHHPPPVDTFDNREDTHEHDVDNRYLDTKYNMHFVDESQYGHASPLTCTEFDYHKEYESRDGFPREEFIPKWIAPNLLTFSGFVCMLLCVLMLLVLDYDCTASGKPGDGKVDEYSISNIVFTLCGVLVFLAYNLDGLDGKQARRIGVSGPLGEMFDHGLDSFIVFLIPYSLFSVFGRDQFSIPVFRAYLIILSIVLNFYISHWEKYNTGTLYLPWGYDLSMWVSTILFLQAGIHGPGVFKTYIYNDVTFVQTLEVAIHATGLFTTLPVAIYNVILSYKNKSGKMLSLIEALRPMLPMLILTVTATTWAMRTSNILEKDPRAFLLTFGTIFSNIASRLIVSEMSGQRCDGVSLLNIPLVTVVLVSSYLPPLELSLLYLLLLFVTIAHLHYGVCVVRQMCNHFRVKCFTVPSDKIK